MIVSSYSFSHAGSAASPGRICTSRNAWVVATSERLSEKPMHGVVAPENKRPVATPKSSCISVALFSVEIAIWGHVEFLDNHQDMFDLHLVWDDASSNRLYNDSWDACLNHQQVHRSGSFPQPGHISQNHLLAGGFTYYHFLEFPAF